VYVTVAGLVEGTEEAVHDRLILLPVVPETAVSPVGANGGELEIILAELLDQLAVVN
jgi:hypothetical protein